MCLLGILTETPLKLGSVRAGLSVSLGHYFYRRSLKILRKEA